MSQSIHRDWMVHQAIIGQMLPKSDEATNEELKFLILHGYSKVATLSVEDATRIGLQCSPIYPEKNCYHRDTRSRVKNAAHLAFSTALGLKATELHLLHSMRFREVLERNIAHFVVLESFEGIGSHLKASAEGTLYIDFSKMIETTKKLPAFLERLKKALLPLKESARVHPLAFICYQGQPLLLHPQLTADESPETYDAEVFDLIAHSGFTLSPDRLKHAWLKVKELGAILQEAGIAPTGFSQGLGKIPTVAKSFESFLAEPVVAKFAQLAQEDDAPYLKVLALATLQLLEGLKSHNIEAHFAEKGLTDYLQIAYFRLLNAMNEAIFHKRHIVPFLNDIGLIHQEIQSFLAITKPYGLADFKASVATKRASEVVLKPSAMHLFATLLSACEAQKKSPKLNVVSLQDIYFETDGVLKLAKKYHSSTLEQAYAKAPVDLFICEFHHNATKKRKVYQPENLLAQVKALIEEGKVAELFTVCIDTTICLEQSKELQAFLQDALIAEKIEQGKLNVLLLRSAQKFDMLGMDNYYGGIGLAINNKEAFRDFNARLRADEELSCDLNLQGITHLQKYAKPYLDAYRQAIMQNTTLLYGALPSEAIFTEASVNPLQVSRIEDDQLVFLDIKFPNFPKSAQSFISQFIQYAKENQLPLTFRASFGFAHSNISSIDDRYIRFSPGLEKSKMISQYAAFFHKVQTIITENRALLEALTQDEADERLASLLAKNTTDVVV